VELAFPNDAGKGRLGLAGPRGTLTTFYIDCKARLRSAARLMWGDVAVAA
jgi:hypothetical protein